MGGVKPRPTPADAIESARTVMTFSSRDWSANHRDAWLYGIIVGCDDDAISEVARKHGWPLDEIRRLKALHAALWECADDA
jgi:hypothetical protein